MSCRTLRRALDERGALAATDPRFANHLAGCAECRAVVARFEAARDLLATPKEELAPPPGFAQRVVVSLPRRAELLGWAALRLLPVSLALAVVAGYLVATTPAPFDLPPGSGSDAELLVWLVLAAGGGS